jgi:hypothetical protein
MTYIRQIHLPRRTLLKGIGGLALALPMLDCMTPAFAQSAAADAVPKRFGLVYFPNGYIKEKWTPTSQGYDYTLSPSLEPLKDHKDKITVLSNLASDPARVRSNFHERAVASLWTGVARDKNSIKAGISADQVAAKTLGKDTPLASLELATEESTVYGYPNYATPTNVLPVETNPRNVFERLFGDADSLDPAVLARLKAERGSILDIVSSEMTKINLDVGAADKVKLDEYYDSVRDIESRLKMHDKTTEANVTLARPSGPPATYGDLVKLIFDLQTVAFQTDKTRVWSMMMGGEASCLEFPEIGWQYPHHLTSHHGGDPAKMEGLARINRYQVSLFDYLLGKMDSIKEANGHSLLDNTMLLYASSLGDADHHVSVDLPMVFAGGAAMGVKNGRHLMFPDESPVTNLYMTMFDRVGVPVTKFGDSNGKMDVLLSA